MAAPSSAPVASEPSPLLSEAIRDHLGDMARRLLEADTISESRHTLRLFLAITTDIHVREIKVDHIRNFWTKCGGDHPSPGSSRSSAACRSWKFWTGEGQQHPRAVIPYPEQAHAEAQGVPQRPGGLDQLKKSPLIGLKANIDTCTDLETGRPFTPDELAAMFEPQRFSAWARELPHRCWGRCSVCSRERG